MFQCQNWQMLVIERAGKVKDAVFVDQGRQ